MVCLDKFHCTHLSMSCVAVFEQLLRTGVKRIGMDEQSIAGVSDCSGTWLGKGSMYVYYLIHPGERTYTIGH